MNAGFIEVSNGKRKLNIADRNLINRLSDARTQGHESVRDLVVFFADICDSTGLYERLGDSSAHQLVTSSLDKIQQ